MTCTWKYRGKCQGIEVYTNVFIKKTILYFTGEDCVVFNNNTVPVNHVHRIHVQELGLTEYLFKKTGLFFYSPGSIT